MFNPFNYIGDAPDRFIVYTKLISQPQLAKNAKLVETSRKQYVHSVYLVIYTKSTSTII
jgi:hypothetical protein